MSAKYDKFLSKVREGDIVTPDATSVVKGKVKLAGDLGGTADLPTVVKTYTKSDVGLGNVDNTSDASKPVSTATQTALDGKSSTVHNHNLNDLTEKSYNSLTDKPDLSSLHSPFLLGTKTVDETDVADGKVLKYNSTSGNLEYETDATGGGGVSVNSLMPQPYFISPDGIVSSITFTSNTQMRCSKVLIPFAIDLNKITVRASNATTPGTVKISLYSEDGQTRLFSVTSPTINSANSAYSITVSPEVAVPAGAYYLTVVSVGTASVGLYGVVGSINAAWNNVSGEAPIEGDLTVTASTPPDTINPLNISHGLLKTIICRFDN